jgi:hypothetical protein
MSDMGPLSAPKLPLAAPSFWVHALASQIAADGREREFLELRLAQLSGIAARRGIFHGICSDDACVGFPDA